MPSTDEDRTYQEALAANRAEVSSIVAEQGTLDEIASFPMLRSLNLRGNRDIVDFTFLKDLPKLDKLFLSDMDLAAIPKEVASLQALTTLFLGKNPIKDFSLLKSLPKLVDLGLEKMGLKKIPDDVLALEGLKILGLYGNDIGALTPLKKLPELEELYAARNNLKKIPKELTKLEKLRKLDIMHNYRLKDWSVVEELSGLEELMMSNAHEIDALPAGIFKLGKLRTLTIAIHWNAPSDPLKGIADIGGLTELESLTITGSGITALPDSFSKLTKLRELDLSDNKELSHVDALAGLPSLVELNLTKCGVLKIGDWLPTLKTLEKLWISNKAIESVDGIRDLPELRFLDLYCKLKKLPETMGTLPKLRTLRLISDEASVSFLEGYPELEDLDIYNCKLEMPPLDRLRKLKILSSEPLQLPVYPELEDLTVTAPSFTLPALPKLTKLYVGGFEEGKLDLSALRELPTLKEIEIARSEAHALPEGLAQAQGVTSLRLELLKKMTDIAAIRDMPHLEYLRLYSLGPIKALPEELATLTGLRKLEIERLNKLEKIDVIAKLSALEELEMDGLKALPSLPASMTSLTKLRRLELDGLDDLEDVSVIEQMTTLEELEIDDCDELSNKTIAGLVRAVDARKQGATPTKALQMDYQHFIESGHYETLVGQEDSQHRYPFPLCFDTHENLLEMVQDFSWLDDYMDDEDSQAWAIFHSPDCPIKILACLDFGYEGCEEEFIDSYAEEIFLVDTSKPQNPVSLWGHDGDPDQIYDNFDSFLAHLVDFDEGQDDGSDREREVGNKTYLEYVDDKSCKFWQIVVEGASHTVSYGKIGAKATSKTKEFDDTAAAQKDADKLIKSKLKKGYVVAEG